MEIKDLIKKAKEASKKAYVPYSKFAVGCALLTKSGKIFTGANIENASYPLCNCGERVTIQSAVFAGEKEFDKIVIYNKTAYPYPCGACRQVMMEFSKDMEIVVAKSETDFKVFKLKDLLPNCFEL